jgi:hypothetical protein
MASIVDAKMTSLYSLYGTIQRGIADAKAVEEAAQKCVELLYEQFPGSLALARIYATVPYGTLPEWNKNFVSGLVKSKQLTVSDHTPVLSLLGTRGSKPEWGDRRKSQGHVGIPLASSMFVESIPMIARLFLDLGVKLDWIDKPEQGINTTRAEWSGLFHVPDAKTSKDQKDRFIIPAQDFVAEEGVKTVFGVGGSYGDARQSFFAAILFTKESIAKDVAERFLPLVTTFKAATAELIKGGKVFAQS